MNVLNRKKKEKKEEEHIETHAQVNTRECSDKLVV